MPPPIFSPEVGCFHGNQAAAFDDGSHEMTPADSAGSSESPRWRMDGWVGGRVVVEVAEKNITDKEKDSHFPQKLNHVTASFFPAGVVYLAPKAGSDRNIVNQMRRSRNGSQPHRPGWHASHLSC